MANADPYANQIPNPPQVGIDGQDIDMEDDDIHSVITEEPDLVGDCRVCHRFANEAFQDEIDPLDAAVNEMLILEGVDALLAEVLHDTDDEEEGDENGVIIDEPSLERAFTMEDYIQFANQFDPLLYPDD